MKSCREAEGASSAACKQGIWKIPSSPELVAPGFVSWRIFLVSCINWAAGAQEMLVCRDGDGAAISDPVLTMSLPWAGIVPAALCPSPSSATGAGHSRGAGDSSARARFPAPWWSVSPHTRVLHPCPAPGRGRLLARAGGTFLLQRGSPGAVLEEFSPGFVLCGGHAPGGWGMLCGALVGDFWCGFCSSGVFKSSVGPDSVCCPGEAYGVAGC